MNRDSLQQESVTEQSGSLWLYLKFILPSLIGIAIFLIPVSYGGKETIIMGVITDMVRAPFESIALEMLVSVITMAAFGSGYYLLVKPDWKQSHPSLYIICQSTSIWFALRTAGALIGWMVYFQVGPELIWGATTGTTVFMDVGVAIFFIVSVACFLMPFLTDFGFMEFIGSVLRKPFELLFKLPGRSAIDATASFVSASTVGLLITIGQYEKGQYTTREAASVATNFSVVSISFSLIIATVAGLDHMFFTWYLTVIAACLICALITVRLPPLSNLPDTYYGPIGKQIHEERNSDMSVWRWASQQALFRASTAPKPKEFIIIGWHTAIGVLFGVLGPCMAIATATAILVFNTPVFEYLSYPLIAVLELLQLPEASKAAPGLVVGILDQFMPALLAGKIDSEQTRFVLAGLSVTQLIYMSEVGVLILRSSLPLNLSQLLMIFVIRTIILLPIFLIAGWWIF